MPEKRDTSVEAMRARCLDPKRSRKLLVKHRVVLVDDNDHTDKYVCRMLHRLFDFQVTDCERVLSGLETTGGCTVFVAHKEVAELAADMIARHGPDPDVPNCPGPMKTLVQPME